MIVHSIECPGAKIEEMISPLLTEISAAKTYDSKITVALCGGLNDLMKGASLDEVIFSIDKFKKEVKKVANNSKFVCVQLPLIPKISKLPFDSHSLEYNRLETQLAVNDYLLNVASDTPHDLSMEDLGVDTSSLGSFLMSFRNNDQEIKLRLLGRKHIAREWREKNLEQAVHLEDRVRRKFWMEKVLPFFAR